MSSTAEVLGIVTLAVGLAAPVVIYARRALKVLGDVAEYVLPHFRPAPPGQPDPSLPARVARTEDGLERMRCDLVRHMDEEERIHEAEARERGRRQDELDSKLSVIFDRLHDLGQRWAGSPQR